MVERNGSGTITALWLCLGPLRLYALFEALLNEQVAAAVAAIEMLS